jgi:hypothetical protein
MEKKVLQEMMSHVAEATDLQIKSKSLPTIPVQKLNM